MLDAPLTHNTVERHGNTYEACYMVCLIDNRCSIYLANQKKEENVYLYDIGKNREYILCLYLEIGEIMKLLINS